MGKKVTIYDNEGNVIATPNRMEFSDTALAEKSYRSFVKLALAEAVGVLADKNKCTTEEAEKLLFKGNYTIHTSFSSSAHAAMDKTYSEYKEEELKLGLAILDYDGSVLAVYSGGDEQYGITGHSPFSTIKPLSVYMQAIEKGIADWSYALIDKPYKQIPDETGKPVDWPTNPSGGYTYKRTTLVECIRQSLNTAAVHTLDSVGVKTSIDFLQTSFGMNLQYEQNKLTLQGEEEVIGNIALGYLYQGVTPVELAGYYQIFGNLGKYTKPHTISRITDKNGDIYTHKSEYKQIISEETAYIMNRLLSAVVTPGGTGSKARVPNADLVGKTGTGNEDGGNWFVGVTPEYTCAVWHGVLGEKGNFAAEIFTKIMEKMPQHTKCDFKTSSKVIKGVYCSQSGKLFSPSCSKIQIGYYARDIKPDVCDAH